MAGIPRSTVVAAALGALALVGACGDANEGSSQASIASSVPTSEPIEIAAMAIPAAWIPPTVVLSPAGEPITVRADGVEAVLGDVRVDVGAPITNVGALSDDRGIVLATTTCLELDPPEYDMRDCVRGRATQLRWFGTRDLDDPPVVVDLGDSSATIVGLGERWLVLRTGNGTELISRDALEAGESDLQQSPLQGTASPVCAVGDDVVIVAEQPASIGTETTVLADRAERPGTTISIVSMTDGTRSQVAVPGVAVSSVCGYDRMVLWELSRPEDAQTKAWVLPPRRTVTPVLGPPMQTLMSRPLSQHELAAFGDYAELGGSITWLVDPSDGEVWAPEQPGTHHFLIEGSVMASTP